MKEFFNKILGTGLSSKRLNSLIAMLLFFIMIIGEMFRIHLRLELYVIVSYIILGQSYLTTRENKL